MLELSHDVPCSGILITHNEKELVHIPDTGYVNKKYIPKLINKDIYIIETNYNDKMLSEGPYPYLLQQRIRSDCGHMSNRYAGSLLSKCIGEKTKCVVQMTLTTYDEELCKKLEPNVCTTAERFEVLKKLRDLGIPTVVWLSPILPFLNDTEENMEALGVFMASHGLPEIELMPQHVYGKSKYAALGRFYDVDESAQPQTERAVGILRRFVDKVSVHEQNS